jgi:hypothetical protein
MGAVSSQLETLGKQVRASQEPAVFADPVALRREREARARQRARQARKARQARARSALAPTGAGRAGAVRAGAAGGRVRPAASPRPGSTYDGRVTPPRED